MKKIKIFLPIFMMLTLMLSFIQPLVGTSQDISEKIFRLHILANSDTSYDQSIKLGMRDYLLDYTADLFIGKTLDENINIAKQNTDKIQSLCNEYLKSRGCDYSASVEVLKEYFKTRVYDDFTLPAGVYNSLKITIGKGSGHNWWCIIFPSVCLSSCSEAMAQYLSEDEMSLVTSGYSPKFKIVEIYEEIKQKIR